MKKLVFITIISILLTGAPACLDLSGSPYADLSPFLAAIVGGDGIVVDTWTGGYIAFSQNTGQLLELESSATAWSTVSVTGVTHSKVELMTTSSGSKILWSIDGTTADVIRRSTDRGRTWTSISVSGGTVAFQSFSTCGDKILVSYGDGAPQNVLAYYSSDAGSTWSSLLSIKSCSSTCTSVVNDVTCSNGTFYVGFSGPPYVTYANDPTGAWTNTTGSVNFPNDLAASDTNILVASAITNPVVVQAATDATAFSTRQSNLGATYTVGYAGTNYVAHQHTTNICNFHRSADATTWTSNTQTCTATQGNYRFNSFAGLGTTVMAGGYRDQGSGNERLMYQSTDSGVSYSEVTLPTDTTSPNQIISVIYYPTD